MKGGGDYIGWGLCISHLWAQRDCFHWFTRFWVLEEALDFPPVFWRSRQGLWRPVTEDSGYWSYWCNKKKESVHHIHFLSTMRMRIWLVPVWWGSWRGRGGGGGIAVASNRSRRAVFKKRRAILIIVSLILLQGCSHLHWPIVQAWGRGSERTLPGNPCSGRCFVSVSGGRWDGPEVGEVWLNR